MAKILLLGILVAIAGTKAAAKPIQLSPDTKKSVDELSAELWKIVNVVAAAAPPSQQEEARHAALTHLLTAEAALEKAKETGDENKFKTVILYFMAAATLINKAPPAEKLQVMEDSINSAAAPNALECPNIDKAYCEMRSKLNKAILGVNADSSPKQKVQAKDSTFQRTVHTAISTVNKAYAHGDEKEIARVLAAYSQAADLVIAAPPSDKLKVMESTFKHAAAMGA